MARKEFNTYKQSGTENIRKSNVSNYSYTDNYFDNNNMNSAKDDNDFKWDQLLADIENININVA